MSEGKKEILLGDCLELMKDIPNGSIDMILCDLPYGVTSCDWDEVIPFDKLWEQYERLIKPNGAIVLFGIEPFSSKLRISNLRMYRYDWVWEKTKSTGFQNSKIQPLRKTENISVFYAKKPTYNPQGLIKLEQPKQNIRNGEINNKHKFNTYKGGGEKSEFTNYPTNLIRFSNPSGKGHSHETKKPIALFEYLIKTYTNENDLVLDNTAGSGTTAIACLKTNRQFIVMEKEQKYYDIILKRVGDFNKNFQPQTLFGNEM